MKQLREFRAGKPRSYPDQSVYAAYAADVLGLDFEDIDGGSGLVVKVASARSSIYFAAGRCSWYPQNSATATTQATDKYFASKILEHSAVATLGGAYFFLDDRYRAYRPPGHDREDAIRHFMAIGASAFIKPLTGSRGDFACAVHGEAMLRGYLESVARHYDSILIQPIVAGREFRILLLDDEIAYVARKEPPTLTGDGIHSIGELLTAHNAALSARGLSPASTGELPLGTILPESKTWPIPGRTNLSAGGTMTLEPPEAHPEACELARRARRALGLRTAAIDLFTDIAGDTQAMRVIEVNGNPSIHLLEDLGREDLIAKIWRHTFSAMGLLDA